MKKIMSTVLALTVTASLTACGAKEATVETPAPNPTEAPIAQMHNPVHYGTNEEVAADTGFLLAAPEGASDVQFSSIEGDPAMAQMAFGLDGSHYVYRVLADDTREDISGLFYTWSNEAQAEIGECAAKLFWNEGEQGHITWVADGVRYDLSTDGGASEQTLTDTAMLVFGTKAESDNRSFAMDFSAALADFCEELRPGTAGVSLRYAAFASRLADLFTECSPTQDDVTNAIEGFVETLESEQMAQFSAQLNSTLTIFEELTGDHGNELLASCGYTPKYENWNSEELKPLFQAMSSVIPAEEIYAGIVEKYRAAIEDGLDRQALTDNDLNYLVSDVGDTPLETLGVAVIDLDDNGTKELIVGTISDDDFLGKLILDLYTLDEAGAPKLLFRSGERNRLYSGADRIFANVGSSGANDSIDKVLILEDGSLNPAEGKLDPAEYTQLDLTPLSEW